MGTREQMSENDGNNGRNGKQFWGTVGTYEIKVLILENRVTKRFISGEQGEQVHPAPLPLPPPHLAHQIRVLECSIGLSAVAAWRESCSQIVI